MKNKTSTGIYAPFHTYTEDAQCLYGIKIDITRKAKNPNSQLISPFSEEFKQMLNYITKKILLQPGFRIFDQYEYVFRDPGNDDVIDDKISNDRNITSLMLSIFLKTYMEDKKKPCLYDSIWATGAFEQKQGTIGILAGVDDITEKYHNFLKWYGKKTDHGPCAFVCVQPRGWNPPGNQTKKNITLNDCLDQMKNAEEFRNITNIVWEEGKNIQEELSRSKLFSGHDKSIKKWLILFISAFLLLIAAGFFLCKKNIPANDAYMKIINTPLAEVLLNNDVNITKILDAYAATADSFKTRNDMVCMEYTYKGFNAALAFSRYYSSMSFDYYIIEFGKELITYRKQDFFQILTKYHSLFKKQLNNIREIFYETANACFRACCFPDAVEYFENFLSCTGKKKALQESADDERLVVYQILGDYYYLNSYHNHKLIEKALAYYYRAFRVIILDNSDNDGMEKLWIRDIPGRIAMLYGLQQNSSDFSTWISGNFPGNIYKIENPILRYYFYKGAHNYASAAKQLDLITDLKKKHSAKIQNIHFDPDYEKWDQIKIKEKPQEAVDYFLSRYRILSSQADYPNKKYIISNAAIDTAIACSLANTPNRASEYIDKAINIYNETGNDKDADADSGTAYKSTNEKNPYLWLYIKYHPELENFRQTIEYKELCSRYKIQLN